MGRVGRTDASEREQGCTLVRLFQLYDASACSEPARLVDLLDQLGAAHKEAGVQLPLFIAICSDVLAIYGRLLAEM